MQVNIECMMHLTCTNMPSESLDNALNQVSLRWEKPPPFPMVQISSKTLKHNYKPDAMNR
jgi:hypothetical protein